MWLIQRGKWRNENTNKLDIPLTGHDGLIDLDYMGSAEFEFGAVAYSMYRIMESFMERKLFDSGIKTRNGLTLWIFCKESDYEAVRAEIAAFIEKPYQLKEWIHLDTKIREAKPNKYEMDNFWWNIYKRDETDWMAFIGANDRMRAFFRTISHDYNEWWLKMPDDEKADRLNRMRNSHW